MNAPQLNQLPLPHLLDALVSGEVLTRLIQAARQEDLLTAQGEEADLTSRLCVPADHRSAGIIRGRKPGTLAGAALIEPIAQAYDSALRVELLLGDGQPVAEGTQIAVITGPLRSMLAAERVLLNFLTHLSGIASLTARYVEAVADTAARIYDTRKTVPGLRHLAKYAVRCGGGYCHRIGLHDAVLIKDNHLAALADRPLDQALREILPGVASLNPPPAFVEVEVDTLGQLEKVLRVPGVDIVLLDNMQPATLEEAVAMRTEHAPHVQLEASGGVDFDTVRRIAQTGVDRIAVGALTHSAPALDIALDIDAAEQTDDA